MRGIALPIVLFLIVLLGTELQACEVDKMGNGCRIFNGQCSCGFGCKSEYRYSTMEECKLALSGGRNNACFKSTNCLNDGTCIQITKAPGYKCACVGTGFYGSRCEKPCPGKNGTKPLHRGPFIIECIVI